MTPGFPRVSWSGLQEFQGISPHVAWTHQPLTNARYWFLISPLSSVSEQGPWVGKETQCVMMQSRGVNPTFGSGRLTSSQICQQLDILLSNTQTLHTLSKLLSSRAAKTSSLPCWFIHDFKCLHHSLKAKQNKISVNLKTKLVKDNLTIVPNHYRYSSF